MKTDRNSPHEMPQVGQRINFISLHAPLLPSKAAIAQRCNIDRKSHRSRRPINWTNHLFMTHHGQTFLIKYDVLACEWENHQYLFHQLQRRHNDSDMTPTFRIPEIYAAFGRGDDLILVMEFIDVDRLASHTEKAEALSKFVAIAHPRCEMTLGPVGGGPVNMHTFWWEKTEYKSVQQLQDHVNAVLRNFKGTKTLEEVSTVDFSKDRVICCYTDLNKSHFLIDKNNQHWIVAFRQVNFLPESFMYFALGNQLKKSGPPIPHEYHHTIIPLTRNSKLVEKLKALQQVRRWFRLSSEAHCFTGLPDPDLGIVQWL